MINNIVGQIVSGRNFIGRTEECQKAREFLHQGNSLLLASPRRVGKSSFAYRIIDEMEKEGWKGLYIDLQGVKDENEFSELLIEKLTELPHQNALQLKARRIAGKAANTLKKIGLKGNEIEFENINVNTLHTAEQYLNVKRKCVIVLDEVAVFLQELVKENSTGRAETMMNWLRKTRLKSADTISWIYCSSVSIKNFCSRNNLSHTINDICSFELGEMNMKEAEHLLYELDEKNKYLTQEAITYILNRIDWKLPFFIQLFYSKCHSLCGIRELKDIQEKTDRIFEAIGKEQFLNSWSERLKGYGKDEEVARAILDYLCQPDAKKDRKQLEAVISQKCKEKDTGLVFSQVRQLLETDGYVMVKNNGDTVFRSPIIRDFWFRNFIK